MVVSVELGGLVLETLSLKVVVLETWGEATGLCNTPYSLVGESMGYSY